MQTIGFYTYPRIAIGETSTIEELQRVDFAKYFREAAFKWRGEGWIFLLSRDGLVQYASDALEKECHTTTESWSQEDISTAKSFEPIWQTYLSHLNVIHFLLDCSLHLNVNIQALEYTELTYTDTTRIRYAGEVAVSQTNYGGHDRDEMIRHGDYKPKDASELRRFNLPESVLTDLCRVYLTPVLADEQKINLILPIAKALSDHNLRNYDVALVLCWFVAERYVNEQWNSLLSGHRITGKRRDKLLGRDYTASVKTEILNLDKVISDDLYEELNSTRIVRNGIAHQFGKRRATKRESIAALSLARKLVEQGVGVQLPFHLHGLPVHGL